MKTTTFLASAVALISLVQLADAHGRLLFPPHRGYIGKVDGFKGLIPVDYSDNGLNAGGIAQTSGGKHGVCGDPYSGVREHETGGTYGLFPTLGAKAIGACYTPGQTLDLQVQVTANHMGYFTFGLCKLNGKSDKETEECFQSLAQPNGQEQWPVPSGNQIFNMQYTLPAGVTCDGDSHCVLRWQYTGWNNPGVSEWGQEHFWNCADVYISNTCGAAPGPSPSSAQPTPAPSTGAPVTDAPWTPTPSSNAPWTPPPVNPTAAPIPPPSGNCGTCTNCYYAPIQALAQYTWCGSDAAPSPQPFPSTDAPWTPPPSSQDPSPSPSSQSPPVPSPSSGGVSQTISWNWFESSTTDCDASLSKDTLNSGLFIGGENIPADCGKTATFSFNGHTVTATYAWRTTGGTSYHELSPNAFAKLLGSSANAANFASAPEFQAAINDPGHVTATCTGVC
ncbi:Aste57867_19176 [Aphanomyces stellatus]|uniref:Aste57867_19176 protein n=1 Tax=Aphanomyces stellatus TaxID=120398 RepID=A0A485LDX8_9STRA|nr:hypothetical protein As57867_019112 [Aphanomyces stellatus]VFT95898.1 Aste57867_19176 [Aphanomyces stellatus]